jgi:hypothetical protein
VSVSVNMRVSIKDHLHKSECEREQAEFLLL